MSASLRRRLGVMLQGATKNTGAAGSPGPGRGNAVPIENRVSDAPTLADLGIDKKTSVPHSSTVNGSHRWTRCGPRSCALCFLEDQVRRLQARFAT